MSFEPGFPATIFGRYQVIDRLAVGGMAEILLARSASLGGVERTCIIKRILPQYSRDLTFVSMFIDEARITIGLDHRNIVRLHDFGQSDGTYFMAIEYVDGTDLAQLMRAHLQACQPVPPALAAFVARELLSGLHHAHALRDHDGKPLGIVHRDVSPQNVLLSSAGAVKLTDFGIAAARHKLTLTSPGTVLGKAAYMAPEQATGKVVDFATDIWAVGVILHELLAGERLFADETPLATIQRMMTATIAPPSRRAPGVPSRLDDIVLTALRRHPRDRYPSARAMADDLDAWLRDNPVTAGGPPRPYDEAELARALARLAWVDETARMRPPHPSQSPSELASTTGRRAFLARGGGARSQALPADLRLQELIDELRAVPNVWTLTALGDRHRALGQDAHALSAYRTAAALFAHRGLLVQAVCAYHGARALLTEADARRDLIALGDLRVGHRAELVELLASFDRHGFWQLMQEADPGGFGAAAAALLVAGQPGPPAPPALPTPPAPLFAALGPLELARLALAVRVRRAAAGEVIIREGEAGDSLFAVGRGRLVVHCRPGEAPGDGGAGAAVVAGDLEEFDDSTIAEISPSRLAAGDGGDRVYLAGLADGDFFGEFSFLAERPRSATVEAIGDCLLLEIDRAAVDDISRQEPLFTEPLLQFYKERVVELVMAKSPLFSLLEPAERRGLLARSTLVTHGDEELIVEEGTLNDHLYFIKGGEVEVFRRDSAGRSIFINKLGQGQFFGEIAALKGTPRTVSVRAMGEVSLLKIDRRALVEIVERQPRLQGLFDATIASRTAEMRTRVREHQLLFFGT